MYGHAENGVTVVKLPLTAPFHAAQFSDQAATIVV